MSLDLRPYDGDAGTLSDFVMQHWRSQYRGLAITPIWSKDYFEWQLPDLLTDDRPLIFAGYDRDRMIGAFPMEPTHILLKGEVRLASSGSWFTVAPEYQRSGIARAAVEAIKAWHREAHAACLVGFINAASYPGKGRGFWHSVFPEHVAFSRPNAWILTLNAANTAKASPTLMDKVGSYVGAACTFGGGADRTGIRAYTADDRDACHALMTAKMRQFDLAYAWSADRLHHHLSFGPIAQCLVLERAGRVAGFCAFHVLDAAGCAPCRMGMVDVLADQELTGKDARRLLRATVEEITARDADFAIMLSAPVHSTGTLLANGFFPYKPTHKLHAFSTDLEAPVLSAQTAYAHYR